MGNRSNKPPFTRRPEDWFSQVRSSEAITSDVDAVLAARFINTTAPITGGGSLAADRTLVLNGTKAEFNAACSDGDFLFVGDVSAYTDEMARDAIGAALVAGTNITITVNDAGDTITIDATGSGYSDEQAQDAVGGILTDSSTIDFTYDDGAGTITAIVKADSIGISEIVSGSSNPGSPASGDLFYRSDLDMWIKFNGTHWLTCQRFHINITPSDSLMPTTATTIYKHRVGNPYAVDFDLWIEKVKTHAFQTAATTASNYFSIAVIKTRPAAGGGDATLATHSTQSLAQNDWINQSTNINALAGITTSGFAISLTETGAQTIYVNAEVTFRLVIP